MGTYDALSPGDTFSSPPRFVTEEDLRELVSRGGYIHPIFTDPSFAATTPFGKSPLPGPAVLLLMGGMVESTGRFDETAIALVGFDSAVFESAAFPGDTLHVDVEVLAKEPTASGLRGTMSMRWRCGNERGETVVEAVAQMIFRLQPGKEGD